MVVLSVLPGLSMTWNMLFHAVLMVQDFMRHFGPMGVDFEVEVAGRGLVGRGNLTIFPEDG